MKYIFTFITTLLVSTSISAQDIVAFQDEKGRWGYKDQSGEVIYKCKLDVADQFDNGVARVGSGDKYGLLGTDGKFVFPMKCSVIEYAADGRFKVAEGGSYDKHGVLKGAKWGYVDSDGEEIIALKYDEIESFSNGEARATLKGKQGYINWHDVELVPFKYPNIGPFNEEELTWAGERDEAMEKLAAKNGWDKTVYLKLTVINRGGKSILPSDEYCLIMAGSEISSNMSDMIKQKGNLATSNNTDYIKDNLEIAPSNGYFVVSSKGRYNSLVNNYGKVLIPEKEYTTITLPVNGISLVVNKKMEYYAYDIANKKRTLISESAFCRSITEDGIILTYDSNESKKKKNDSNKPFYEYRDLKGKVIGSRYDFAYDFSDGVGVVCKNGLYGAIDTQGSEHIKFKYDSLGVLKDGVMLAKATNGKFGYINKNDEEIIPINYDRIGSLINGRMWVKSGDKYGCVDNANNIVVPIEWDDIIIPTNLAVDVAMVKDKDRGWAIYSFTTSSIVSTTLYDGVKEQLKDGLFVVSKNNQFAVVDKDGIEVIPFFDGDVEHAKLMYEYQKSLGEERLPLIDLVRYSRRVKNQTSTYSINHIIDESAWDY